MKTLIKTLLLLAAVAYLVFAVVRISRPTDEVVCTGMDIVLEDSLGTTFITETDIRHLLASHKVSPQGMRMGDIDIPHIESLLLRSPSIDTVACYQAANGKLCIRVIPMHPVLHVMTEDGSDYYIDRTGRKIGAYSAGTNLPIATGQFTAAFAAKHLAPLAESLLADEFWRLNTQQIAVDPQGHVILIPRVGDFIIRLGEIKNVEDKLARLRLFYEEGLPCVGWNRYSQVSAEYKGQIVCKKRK